MGGFIDNTPMGFSEFKGNRVERSVLVGVAIIIVAVLAGCDEKGSRIHISTTPAGAGVYCNNQKLGTSPLSVVLPPKSRSDFNVIYVIEARLSGYEPAREYLTEGQAGELAGRDVRLQLLPLPEGLTDLDVPEMGKFIPRGAASNYLSRVTCEIMLVRVSDGRVLSQASGMVCDDFLARLSARLTGIIKRYVPPGPSGTLAVCSIRNRRETKRGWGLADKLTHFISREMSFASSRGLARNIDLRPLVSESEMDLPKILKRRNVRDKLKGIEYVIIGGLAETVAP